MRDGGVRRVAGVQQVLRALVIALLAGHAAHDGELVRHARELRHVLADHHAGHARLDRLERAGDLAGLRIPGVDVARSAVHPEEDDALRLAPVAAASSRRSARALQPARRRRRPSPEVTPARSKFRRVSMDASSQWLKTNSLEFRRAHMTSS